MLLVFVLVLIFLIVSVFSSRMKVFVLLCLATVAFAEKRNFLGGIGDLLGGGGGELGSGNPKSETPLRVSSIGLLVQV